MGPEADRLPDQPGVEVLDEHDCLELLRESDVGRLAVVVEGGPEIFPVNFVVDHGLRVGHANNPRTAAPTPAGKRKEWAPRVGCGGLRALRGVKRIYLARRWGHFTSETSRRGRLPICLD